MLEQNRATVLRFIDTKKLLSFIFCLSFSLITSGCAHVPRLVPISKAGFSLKKPFSEEYPYKEIQGGKGLVIFLRPSSLGPIGLSYWEIAAAATKFTTFANEENLGPLPSDSYRLYHANPGQNTLLVKAPVGR